MARTGSYTDRDGNEKSRWTKCGVVFESSNGLSLKLESVPVGNDWNGFFSLFEPKPRTQPAPASPEFDDDVPF